MELYKALNFIKKHKTLIFLPIICFCHLLACFYADFWIVATIFSITLLSLSEFADIVYYTLFFQMFSSNGKFSVISTFTAAVFICIKYIYGVIKKKEKFYVVPFILTCIICLFGALRLTKPTTSGIYQGAALIAALFIIYFIFVYRDRLKISKCADFLIYGILASAGISLITMALDNFAELIVNISGKLHGIKLLTGNENSLSIYCSLALAGYVSNIINQKENIFKNIILGLVAIGFGLSTMSKCFLITCSFIILYLFFMMILKYKLKSFIFIAPAVLLLVVVSLSFNTPIEKILDRFVSEIDGQLSLSVITTGRSRLWTMYINEITSSIPQMLFGVGLFGKRLVRIGPHNLFIHILYRIGFIGIILLGILTYYYYKSSGKTLKPTLKNSLILLVFLMISMVESFL